MNLDNIFIERDSILITSLSFVFSHMWSLLKQLRVDQVLMEDNPSLKLTLVVPSNAAWEKAQRSFSKAYNTLVDGQFPQYVSVI